jgi:glycosyltransferase involved in cell wall biosynthesis
MPKKIILSTSNDISTDNRVHKVAMLLLELGYNVHWVGRLQPNSVPLDRPYETTRMRLLFKKGGLFYAEFQVRLFFFLLLNRSAVLVSNDLDTLLPNYLVSRLYHSELVYDSHEYFCGVPEIQGRWVKKVWLAVERLVFPKLTHSWTVNESIADLYEKDYGIRPQVFRNISPKPHAFEPKTRRELGLPEHLCIAINQGSGMNVDRGLEEAVSAVAGMEGWLLLLVGSGDAIPSLKEKVAQEGWQGKVKFIDRIPYDQLLHYTAAADVGLSLDKDSNINYRFSLPNKLFDYIHCNTPVVTSRVIEVKRIVEDYNVGLTVHVENILALRRSIAAVAEHREAYDPGLKHAQEALSWEKECIPLRNFYAQFL